MINRISKAAWYEVFSFDWRTFTTRKESDMGIKYTNLEKVFGLVSTSFAILALILVVRAESIFSLDFIGGCALALNSSSLSWIVTQTSRERRIQELIKPKSEGG